MSDTHFHPLRVRAVRPETDEAMVVTFDVPPELGEHFRFTQGQYLTLRRRIDDEDVRRSYSICAGLDDGELRVGVRRVKGGRFSNWLAEHLRAGDLVDVMPPQGRFFVPLDPAASRHYLGVAGGSGITPVLSIMKTVLAREPGSRFTLVYGNRRAASTMFKEELEDLKNRYFTRLALHHVFSEERVDSPLNQGVLDRAKLAEFLGGLVAPGRIDHAFVERAAGRSGADGLRLLREEAFEIVALALELVGRALDIVDARAGRRRHAFHFLDRKALAFLVHPKILLVRSMPLSSAAMSASSL